MMCLLSANAAATPFATPTTASSVSAVAAMTESSGSNSSSSGSEDEAASSSAASSPTSSPASPVAPSLPNKLISDAEAEPSSWVSPPPQPPPPPPQSALPSTSALTPAAAGSQISDPGVAPSSAISLSGWRRLLVKRHDQPAPAVISSYQPGGTSAEALAALASPIRTTAGWSVQFVNAEGRRFTHSELEAYLASQQMRIADLDFSNVDTNTNTPNISSFSSSFPSSSFETDSEPLAAPLVDRPSVTVTFCNMKQNITDLKRKKMRGRKRSTDLVPTAKGLPLLARVDNMSTVLIENEGEDEVEVEETPATVAAQEPPIKIQAVVQHPQPASEEHISKGKEGAKSAGSDDIPVSTAEADDLPGNIEMIDIGEAATNAATQQEEDLALNSENDLVVDPLLVDDSDVAENGDPEIVVAAGSATPLSEVEEDSCLERLTPPAPEIVHSEESDNRLHDELSSARTPDLSQDGAKKSEAPNSIIDTELICSSPSSLVLRLTDDEEEASSGGGGSVADGRLTPDALSFPHELLPMPASSDKTDPAYVASSCTPTRRASFCGGIENENCEDEIASLPFDEANDDDEDPLVDRNPTSQCNDDRQILAKFVDENRSDYNYNCTLRLCDMFEPTPLRYFACHGCLRPYSSRNDFSVDFKYQTMSIVCSHCSWWTSRRISTATIDLE